MKRRFLAMLILLAELLPTAAATQTDAPPLPERNPGRTGAPARKHLPLRARLRPYPGATPVAAAKAKCTEALSSVKLDYKLLPPIREGLCGAPAPILLKSLGSDTKVEIDPPATVTCALAKALSVTSCSRRNKRR